MRRFRAVPNHRPRTRRANLASRQPGWRAEPSSSRGMPTTFARGTATPAARQRRASRMRLRDPVAHRMGQKRLVLCRGKLTSRRSNSAPLTGWPRRCPPKARHFTCSRSRRSAVLGPVTSHLARHYDHTHGPARNSGTGDSVVQPTECVVAFARQGATPLQRPSPPQGRRRTALAGIKRVDGGAFLGVSVKSKSAKFSAIRSGRTDFGAAERPSSRCQRGSTEWAGVLPYLAAMSWSVGSSKVFRAYPRRRDQDVMPPIGDQAWVRMPCLACRAAAGRSAGSRGGARSGSPRAPPKASASRRSRCSGMKLPKPIARTSSRGEQRLRAAHPLDPQRRADRGGRAANGDPRPRLRRNGSGARGDRRPDRASGAAPSASCAGEHAAVSALRPGLNRFLIDYPEIEVEIATDARADRHRVQGYDAGVGMGDTLGPGRDRHADRPRRADGDCRGAGLSRRASRAAGAAGPHRASLHPNAHADPRRHPRLGVRARRRGAAGAGWRGR